MTLTTPVRKLFFRSVREEVELYNAIKNKPAQRREWGTAYDRMWVIMRFWGLGSSMP